MESGTDAELLIAWRTGSRASGDVLMRRHYSCVLRYFELNATWVADDLTQRTFVACLEKLSSVPADGFFRAYLLGIARRQLVMHRRTLARSRTLQSFDDDAAPSAQTRLSTLVARTQEHVALLRSLAALPSAPQLLLVLHYWQGVPTPVLAVHHGVHEGTIRTRMLRARRRLRELFARTIGASDPDNISVERLEALLADVLISGGLPGHA